MSIISAILPIIIVLLFNSSFVCLGVEAIEKLKMKKLNKVCAVTALLTFSHMFSQVYFFVLSRR